MVGPGVCGGVSMFIFVYVNSCVRSWNTTFWPLDGTIYVPGQVRSGQLTQLTEGVLR